MTATERWARRPGSLSSLRLARGAPAGACGAFFGGASNEAIPECQRSRIARETCRGIPAAWCVELRIGSEAKPVDDAADQDFRLNDLEFAWMAPRFSVSTPDSACSVLTGLNVAGVEHDARRRLCNMASAGQRSVPSARRPPGRLRRSGPCGD